MKKEGKERIAKCKAEKLCCGCMQPRGDGSIVRGLHFTTCYSAARDLIKAGKATEAELVADGRMLPRATPGRKASNPLTIQYSG